MKNRSNKFSSFWKKFVLFLNRFRRLPNSYWLTLATIFGIVDFLTWSILDKMPGEHRWPFTLAIASAAFIGTLLVVLIRPSETEKISSARALYRMARDMYNKADYPEALNLLEASVHLDKDNAAAMSLLGRSLVNCGKFTEAIVPLNRGMELSQISGNKRILLLSRAIAYYHLGNYGQAQVDLDQIISENANHVQALRHRAKIWLILCRPDNALTDIDTALKKMPNYLCGHAIKVLVLEQLGRNEEASEELKQCNDLIPEDAVDFYCLSLAHSRLGKIDQALTYLRNSIQRDTKCLHRALNEPWFDRIKEHPKFSEITSSISESAEAAN